MKKTVLFVSITCLVSWALALTFYLSGFKFQGAWGIGLGVIYMLIPMTVGLIIQKLFYKQEVKESWQISFRINKWFLLAWLLPPFFNILTIFISLLFPQVSYSPDMSGIIEHFAKSVPPEKIAATKAAVASMPFYLIMLITLVQGLVAGISINGLVACGEEFGWRGFMFSELKHLNFWKASVIIGAVWGIWHFPLILMGHNYPEHNVAGVFMMTLFCILSGPLFMYVTIKTRSVIAAAIMHGTLNGTAGLALMVVKGGNDLIVGMTGAAGMIAIFLSVAGLYLVDKLVLKENIMSGTVAEALEK